MGASLVINHAATMRGKTARDEGGENARKALKIQGIIMHKYGEQKWGEEEYTIWGGIMCDKLGEIKAHR